MAGVQGKPKLNPSLCPLMGKDNRPQHNSLRQNDSLNGEFPLPAANQYSANSGFHLQEVDANGWAVPLLSQCFSNDCVHEPVAGPIYRARGSQIRSTQP